MESTLKQILYSCVEHVQATKAALYLSATPDLNQKTYELVTSYQYNATGREVVTGKDDLVDRLVVRRSPFYINGFGSDREIAEMLFRQGNDRLLIAPLFSRGRLVGFIDMRDKAARKPFENSDLEAAGAIADEVLRVLAEKKLYGIAPVALVELPPREAVSPTPPRTVAPASKPEMRATPGGVSEETKQVIAAARDFLSRRQLTRSTGRRAASERDIDVLQLLLPGALALPGALFATLSSTAHTENPRHAVSRATLATDALDALQEHIRSLLHREHPGRIDQQMFLHPAGVQSIPASAQLITAIISSPVSPDTIDGLFLTVGFEHFEEADAQRALRHFLRQLEQPLEAALANAGGADRQTIAENLLEPDFARYPALAEHSRRVSVMAHRFARALELSPTQAETIRIAALVHDIGFRLIDYDALYSEPGLTPEQKRLLKEHPIVGAALVEPLLGPEVAQAVLRHHERVDGTGYPSRLSGDQIPRNAKIIQIADAWIAMTTHQPYQMALPYDIAVARMREVAGTQLDRELVEIFLEELPKLIA